MYDRGIGIGIEESVIERSTRMCRRSNTAAPPDGGGAALLCQHHQQLGRAARAARYVAAPRVTGKRSATQRQDTDR